METIKTAFLEQPAAIYVVLALALAGLAAAWWQRRTRVLLWLMPVPLVLGGAVLLVERLVVTDREQIVSNMRDIASAFEAGRSDDILPHLDSDFLMVLRGMQIRRQGVVLLATERRQQWQIESVKPTAMEVAVAGNFAEMSLTTLVRWGYQGMRSQSSLSWQIHWVRQGERWLIRQIDEPIVK